MASLFQSTAQGRAAPGDECAALARDLASAVIPGHWDELRGKVSDGESGAALAPLWNNFFRLLGPGGFDALGARQQQLLQQIHDDGVTYNVHADAAQAARAWSVDLFPLLIDASSWKQISTGAAQRAALLNTVLADLYTGPQRTLKEGLLPPALVQGHPGYLRALHGHTPPGNVWLHIAAFDLARGPDGVWRVVNQRVQAPSGLGYLLENRILISRLFPDAFSQLKVQRLAASYRLLMDTLLRQSPGGVGSRVVLLTPGPYSETYFEQVYLARYLGITLAEGSDLTVREDRLYLKTLRGLEPVHVVLRRLDDSFCDPLELRPDSMLGVAGLLQAVRAGHVLVANALGAGFLESPAVQGFLPKLCETLLGEPLILPSLPTWWCGEPGVCDAPLDDLRSWVIKPVHAECGFEATVMASLDYGQLPPWRERVHSAPAQVTLQQYQPLPHVPVWSDDRLAARAAMLRVYALADGQGGWRVLPGGLVRTAPRGGNTVSMQRGGSSQDAWVITGDAVDDSTLLPPPMRPQDLVNRHRVVTSRAAENLFWLGRYSERAEHGARLMRIALRALSGDDDLGPAVRDMLDQWCRQSGLIDPEAQALSEHPQAFERSLVRGLMPGPHAGGLVQSIQALGHAAAQVRERLGGDHRQWIASATALELLPAQARREELQTTQAMRGLEQLTEVLSAITGAQTDRMTRDDGWRLLSIGRHIERLTLLGEALSLAFQTRAVHSDSGFNLLLALFDSTITYRALYQKRLEVPALLDLLMLDRENPRALGWVAQTLRARMAKLPDTWVGLTEASPPPEPRPAATSGPLSADKQALLALAPDPDDWHLPELCTHTQEQHYTWLELTLAQNIDSAWRLSDEISRRYFAHANAPDRTLGGY
ncbi:circularly permuted type 2 ATP-grasp protein [Thiomonas intermedia]|uniref:circularly permuted type 2 ATP-grasp protein n=1 Tax=Thiomonas intermedia TaxID=926 RepID=UPI0009A52C11|nr:circularly permuted type 2 ATP-grasp protein [Thiomonas intermedia]